MSRSDSVGIAAQSGPGPGGLGAMETAMNTFLPVESATRDPSIEEMNADETLGVPFATDRDTGTVLFQPQLTGKVRANSAPVLLSTFWGDPASAAGTDPGTFVHSFDPVVNLDPRALSVLLTNSDPEPPIVDLLWDCIGSELQLDVEANDWISFQATLLARSLDDTQPAPTPVCDLSSRFNFYRCTVELTEEGGSAVEIPVATWGITYGLNPPDDTWVLGSRYLYRVAPGNRECEVRFTPREDLLDWWRRVLALDPSVVQLKLKATGPVIGAGPGRFGFEVDIPRLQAVAAPVEISGADNLEGIEITAQAALDPATSKFLLAKVTNDVPDYAVTTAAAAAQAETSSKKKAA